jgi:hypothetical protein
MSQVSPGVIVLLLYFEGVSRLMIVDLEAEKAVDRSKCLGIVSGHSQLRTALGILGLICDFAFQPLHGLYAWRHPGMDKHRNGKIGLGKLYGDHRQMLTDSLLGGYIGGLVALYLDSATVSQKMEMMSRFLVTKTHALIATGVHARKMVSRVWRSLLGNCAQTRGAKSIQEKRIARARQEKFARILAAIPEDKRSMVVEAISILGRACS